MAPDKDKGGVHEKHWWSPTKNVSAVSVKEAFEHAREYRKELLEAKPREKQNVKEYLEEWHGKRRRASERTGKPDPQTISRLDPVISRLGRYFQFDTIEYLTPSIVEDRYDQMRDVTDEAITENMVWKAHQTLKNALGQLADRGEIERNPCGGVSIKCPPRDEGLAKSREIPVDTARKFAKHIVEQPKTGRMVALVIGMMTGCREGEVLGLEWAEVDFDEMVIVFAQQYTRDKRLKKPKGEKTRAVPMDVFLAGYLLDWKAELMRWAAEKDMTWSDGFPDGDEGEHSAQELADVIVGEGNPDKWPAWVLRLFANSGGLPVIDVEGAVAGLAAKRASE